MTEVYFHWSNTSGVLVDRGDTSVSKPDRSADYVELVIRTLVSAPGLQDWRNRVLHVSDRLGEEILALPFASIVGTPH